MFLLLLFSLLMLSLVRISVHEILAPAAEKAHFFCISHLPQNAAAISELKALVCAENFTTLVTSHLYISSGLIHLFVVSGAHLLLLEKLLTHAKVPPPIMISIMILYGFACNLNAPVVRCLIAFLLAAFLAEKNIKWPPHFRLLIVGTLALSINFNWITSFSLQMSWIATFLLMLGEKLFCDSSAIFKQSLFFVTLLPTLVFFQIPSPMTILLNVILAPLLEFILFPLALITWFAPGTHPFFDFSILLFKNFLSFLELDFQIQPYEIPGSLIIFNWGLILSLHAGFHLRHVHESRKTLL